MSAVCATATPVDIVYVPAPPKLWNAQPLGEISSEGSDASSQGTPEQKPTSVKHEHLAQRRCVAQKCERRCYDPDFDLRLATRVIELMGVKVDLSITQALSESFGAKPCEVDRAERLLFRSLRLLRLCGYPNEDIEVIVAQASVYMRDVAAGMRTEGRPGMRLTETVHIISVLIYLAHAYCEDQNCPLHVWHRNLFQRYCTLSTLNAAVVGLLGRLRFRLRVEAGELEATLRFIRQGGAAPASFPLDPTAP